MKKLLLTLAAIAVITIGHTLFTNNTPKDTDFGVEVTTVSTENASFSVRFTENHDYAKLISNETEYLLKRAPSGSGARYTNKDETLLYWEHHGEATIIINGQTYIAEAVRTPLTLSFVIEPYTKTCIGETKKQCLVVNNELFYDEIQGFDFKEGTSYELLVERTERDDVPADASMYKYKLIEIVSAKTTDNEEVTPLDGTSWIYNEGKLIFSDSRYAVNFGCNSISGEYEQKLEALSFSEPISTRMACEEEVMEVETMFIETISQISSFSETENKLILSGDNVELVLKNN